MPPGKAIFLPEWLERLAARACLPGVAAAGPLLRYPDDSIQAAGVIVYDAGTGKTTGFSSGGRSDVDETAKQIIEPLRQFGVTELKNDMEWGTDHFDFMLEGVPTFVADQEEANYLVNYHAVSDTYDKVDFPQLKKHVAEAAEFAFSLANLPEKIGPRFTRAQIEQSIHETHSDELFKAFGLWDAWESGNLGRQK